MAYIDSDKDRIYRSWHNIKKRCYDPRNPGYSTCGAKGQTMCDEWRDSFESFYNWAIKNGYGPSKALVRENVNKGFNADNCKWVVRTPRGMSTHPLYHKWKAMRERCRYSKNKAYSHYGGRGITICDEWRGDFMAFYDWAMTHGWEPGLTIERIDVDGNYCPENCKFATMKEQGQNKTNSLLITIDGITKTQSQWCEEYGINKTTFRHRLERGWDAKKALTEPIMKNQFS